MAALLAACTALPPQPRIGWQSSGDVENLVLADRAGLMALQDLTAEVSIELSDGEDNRLSATGSVLFRPPDLLRLDVRGSLFQHVLTAVLYGDSLFSLSQGEHRRFSARRGLQTYLNIDIADYDPRFLLLGAVQPGTLDPDREVEYPRGDRAIVYLADAAGGQRALRINLYRGFVESEELFDAYGELQWRRLLRAYRRLELGGSRGVLYLPAQVEIRGRRGKIKLGYRNWKLNRELPDAAFTQGVEAARR
ncbi:MAG: hypothetical protein VX733_05390 [Candidatus Latescibacterota bacterium]|nr:hypothetical protein [Candidatus Latescibacterota bacterium]